MVQPCWVTLCQLRAEKIRLVTHLILRTHMLAFFMMLLTQTAGHILKALMVMFLRLTIVNL